MDLSLLKETLGNYETFGGNIGTALKGIPELLTFVIEFFQDFGDNADTTSENLDNLSS
ncbi:PorH family porin [Corynebacterium deserti]|uniref:PorH family porin n=1 Tax=Corynebacterium deserti TaxID=1408191 RepID=UPI000B23A303|nr:PorH family porin [Corynebacterium deserti]